VEQLDDPDDFVPAAGEDYQTRKGGMSGKAVRLEGAKLSRALAYPTGAYDRGEGSREITGGHAGKVRELPVVS
jgi:hypothetical protein